MTFKIEAEPLFRRRGNIHSADLPIVEIELKSSFGMLIFYFKGASETLSTSLESYVPSNLTFHAVTESEVCFLECPCKKKYFFIENEPSRTTGTAGVH